MCMLTSDLHVQMPLSREKIHSLNNRRGWHKICKAVSTVSLTAATSQNQARRRSHQVRLSEDKPTGKGPYQRVVRV